MSAARSTLAGRITQVRPRVIAALAAQLRDLDLAEDSFAAACEALLASEDADIRDPAAWLFRAGMRKAIDAKRKNEREAHAGKAAMILHETQSVIRMPDPIPDERLRLLFVCCHPALAREARVALALKVVCGLPVDDIARAFAVPVPTMYQRIARAKAKISGAKIPFELPHRSKWPERITSVLGALEVGYLVGYGDAGGAHHPEFAGETMRLADMLVELMPENPEVKGFAALLALAASRRRARVDSDGAMVPLSQQNTALWDRDLIEKGRALLEGASEVAKPGPYQAMAAIHLSHALRLEHKGPDWRQILALYDALMVMRPGPMVAINRAIALGKCGEPVAGLIALGCLDEAALAMHRPFLLAKADLFERISCRSNARELVEQALFTQPGKAERRFIEMWRDRLID